MSKTIKSMNKKKKFVADGVFYAELHSFLQRALAAAGYAGIQVKVTPVITEIRIKAAKISEVIGKQGLKLRELTALVQKRFNYKKDSLRLVVEKVNVKELCAAAQADNCKYKLMARVPVRLAANSIIRNVMTKGAKGCEVIISGKLRQQRAKSMKFRQGDMLSAGQPAKDYVDVAVRHVFMKQGMLGVKVKIYQKYDASGQQGVQIRLADDVSIHEPKVEQEEEEIRNVPQQQNQ